MKNKKIDIIQLGFGTVGREFVRQFISLKPRNLNLAAVFNSQGTVYPEKLSFFRKPEDFMIQHGKKRDMKIIIADMSNSDNTADFLSKQSKRGITIVLSNKKPLCLPYNQHLLDLKSEKVFYETTVGAGLPVVSTLKSLLATGDKIIGIKGNFSGTLGFLMSQLESDMSFSQAVSLVKAKGYTETDPREDLKGTDVARKLLILARTMGMKIDIDNIKVMSLYPSKMDRLSVPEFLERTRELDKYYFDSVKNARKNGKTIKYVGVISKNRISAALLQVDKSGDLGNLQGPDNLIVIRSQRYNLRPLVIKGPGAGAAVTAAGVMNDCITAANLL